ncbi:hypothetical protein [Clostridium gasigenes]|nr:hypothetical protein [Clostridium gasigenes]
MLKVTVLAIIILPFVLKLVAVSGGKMDLGMVYGRVHGEAMKSKDV